MGLFNLGEEGFEQREERGIQRTSLCDLHRAAEMSKRHSIHESALDRAVVIRVPVINHQTPF